MLARCVSRSFAKTAVASLTPLWDYVLVERFTTPEKTNSGLYIPESMKGSNYVRTLRDEIISCISYTVGCLFVCYYLDVEGLSYADGK